MMELDMDIGTRHAGVYQGAQRETTSEGLQLHVLKLLFHGVILAIAPIQKTLFMERVK